jgi:multidrug efflux pump subunit AcrA (membrane-fusion protein)
MHHSGIQRSTGSTLMSSPWKQTLSRLLTHPTFNAAPQTALKEENKMTFPRGTRSIPVRSLNAMAAALSLVFGSSLPLNAQPKAPEVTVANPVVKRIVQWDEYTGQFEAVRRVEVRARVSGELVKIHFTDGQTVKAGDILFTIDPRPFEIAVEAARAEVARARAQVAVTGNDLERAEQLTPSKVLTQRDFDQRKANHDAAKAQLQSAEAMLRNASCALNRPISTSRRARGCAAITFACALRISWQR